MNSVPDRQAFITGYPQPFGVAPGGQIEFMIHAEGVADYRGELVRLDRGPGGDSSPMPGLLDVAGLAPRQRTVPGSYVSIDDQRGALQLNESFTLHALIMPTAPNHGQQAIMGRWSDLPSGCVLLVDAGYLTLWLEVGGQRHDVRLAMRLQRGVWYSVTARYDFASGLVTLRQRPLISSTNGRFGPAAGMTVAAETEARLRRGSRSPATSEAAFLIAGRSLGMPPQDRRLGAFFNGKIEGPRVYDHAVDATTIGALDMGGEPESKAPAAHWDFSVGIGTGGIQSDLAIDRGPAALHGVVMNSPARGVTGHLWDGRETDFRAAPQQYAAIHFHDDDLDDAQWEPTVRWTVPIDTHSGLYALKLRGGGRTDHIPFVVRPEARQNTRPAVAVLLPTATYLAYSNQVPVFEGEGFESGTRHVPIAGTLDLCLYEHPEFGFSAYDRHTDGSGILHISWRRPILNLRPDYLNHGALWALPADLCLLDWLRALGIEHDVVTDDDLHREGVSLLRPYRAVLTGTHPEYASEAMLDGIEEYVTTGGRVMYLGGNGFYWVVSFDNARPHVMEVRKPSGSAPWITAPGEYRHSTTGEPGGLWKLRGRAPQKLFGVGFSAQGFDVSSCYRLLPDGLDDRVAWIFDGVGDRERVGDHGSVGGGAAGLELDRYDSELGSPPQTVLLASSYGHTDGYLHTADEVDVMGAGRTGTYDPDVRADMTYFEVPNGGAVFSTGSIAWCGSLGDNGYDNDVARITSNVLRRFVEHKGRPLDSGESS